MPNQVPLQWMMWQVEEKVRVVESGDPIPNQVPLMMVLKGFFVVPVHFLRRRMKS